MADLEKGVAMDDDIDAGIRELLREPTPESAQERAISFAATRLELDMAEIARMRRGDHRRRLGRAMVAICVAILCSIGIATAVDSTFLRQVLGEDAPIDDPIEGVATVTPSMLALKRSDGTNLPDDLWAGLQQAAELLAAGGAPLDRQHARVVLRYDEPGMLVRIAAAQKADGRACFVARGAVSNHGCTKGFDELNPLVAQLGHSGNRSSVIGLAADEVRCVTIELPDGNRTAVLRNNAFLWIADHARDVPKGVVADLTDGTRVHLRIANAPARLPHATS